MTTHAEARAKRVAELQHVANDVNLRKEFTLAPEMDEDARALYWIAPWDQRRYAKVEKVKLKKDLPTDGVTEIAPRLAIQMYLAKFSPSPQAIRRWKNGGYLTGPHRCIGFLESGTLSTYREYARNWHKKLNGWTVNLHILQYAERFGIKDVEINGKVYEVKRLLDCPLVPRKESGGYEVNVLLQDPENVYRDTWDVATDSTPE